MLVKDRGNKTFVVVASDNEDVRELRRINEHIRRGDSMMLFHGEINSGVISFILTEAISDSSIGNIAIRPGVFVSGGEILLIRSGKNKESISDLNNMLMSLRRGTGILRCVDELALKRDGRVMKYMNEHEIETEYVWTIVIMTFVVE